MTPAEMRDKSRYGGNYLPVSDPLNKQNFTPFHLFVSGHIESGQVNDYDGLCCKYDFIAGNDWQFVEVRMPNI